MDKLNQPIKITGHIAIYCLIVSGLLITSAYASSFEQAIVNGKTNIDIRLRYETVDDSTNLEAEAATLRTRLGYLTGSYEDIYAFGEFEDVRTVAGMENYAPLNPGYATVADPVITQLNQAYIGYQGLADSSVKIGRQRIILDNARHIGNVGWRQNEQTFDALLLENKSISHTTVTYAYLDKVRGIMPVFDANVSDHLLNLTFSAMKAGNASVYAYLLEDDVSKATIDTYGLRFNGMYDLSSETKFLYTLEHASQSTDTNDASYTLAEAGLNYSGVTGKLAYEILGSDSGTYGFQTPLATKHAFNGWADQFLATPVGGLQDMMFTLSGKVSGIKLMGTFHDYSSDEGSIDYGTELDLLVVKKFSKRYTLGVKYSNYSADSWKNDTNKLWLWAELNV